MVFGLFIRIHRIRWSLASQYFELKPLSGSRWVIHVGLFRGCMIVKSFDLVSVTAGEDDIVHWTMKVDDVEHCGSEPLRTGDKFVLLYRSRIDSSSVRSD